MNDCSYDKMYDEKEMTDMNPASADMDYPCKEKPGNSLSPIDKCDFISVHEDVVNRVKQQMAAEEDLMDLADFFKVFADSTRIKILYVLRCSEMCVCDLASILGMTQSAISHQLRTLKQMGLVKNRRDGKTVFYSLSDGHIQSILDQGMDHIKENY